MVHQSDSQLSFAFFGDPGERRYNAVWLHAHFLFLQDGFAALDVGLLGLRQILSLLLLGPQLLLPRQLPRLLLAGTLFEYFRKFGGRQLGVSLYILVHPLPQQIFVFLDFLG